MNNRILSTVTVLVLAVVFINCGGKDKLKNTGGEAPVFAVNTTTAAQGEIWDYIALSGDIVAGSTVDVFSDVAGRITAVYVELGSRVSRGSPIAAVDPSRPGMYYIPAVATSTIAGTVIVLPAQVGATVNQAVPLARISGTGALEIRLYVAERFISKVAMNQLCEITLDAWPGEVFHGIVTEISPVVDAASRTMEVKVNVTNQGDKLKEGMFAKVKLITEQKENIVKIPATALIQRFGENYIYVTEELINETPETPAAGKKESFGKKNEESAGTIPPPKRYKAVKRIVKPGIMIDGALEIEAGLKPGEEFIVKGQTLLNDGAEINIVERVKPLSAER